MKTIDFRPGESIHETGVCILTYSESGWGKSGALATLDEPITIIHTEPRDPRVALGWCKKDIKFWLPQGFDEIEDLLHQMEVACQKGKFKYKSIGFDSLSFTQSSFKMEMEDFRYDINTEKDEIRGLGDRFALTEKDWGPLGSSMKRITASLNRLSHYGIVVVANSTPVEHPRWNRTLRAAPAFQGKDFGSVFNGYFDFIFYLTKGVQILQDGKVVPPVAAFHSPDGDFVAKCCNNELLRRQRGPLDYQKILKIIRRGPGGIQKEEVVAGQKDEMDLEAGDGGLLSGPSGDSDIFG